MTSKSKHPNNHIVQFYDSESFLVKSIKDYLKVDENPAIIIAKDNHINALQKLSSQKLGSQHTILNAAKTLDQFMSGDNILESKFYEIMSKTILESMNGNTHVKVFGEMVAILWSKGNRDAAVRLEELWNELSKRHSFTLLCAYPMGQLKGANNLESFSRICASHSSVLPTERYSQIGDSDDRLREIAILQQKAKTLEDEVHRRKKLEKQKDEFIALISHELKTPVTVLKAYTQHMHSHFLKSGDENSASNMHKMNFQIEKLNKLIEDLLDIAKIEKGKLNFDKQFVDFNVLVQEIVEEVGKTAKNYSFKVKGQAKNKVFGDRYRLGQVLYNLLNNAIKYSAKSKEIDILIEENNEILELSVQDFGIGISEDEQKYIFDQYYRVNETVHGTYPGIGLGLFISSEIVKRHGGKIAVKSKVGEGTTFSVKLPLNVNKESRFGDINKTRDELKTSTAKSGSSSSNL